MEIIIKRLRKTQWGIDGALVINEEHVCDTVENTLNHLPAGTYSLAFFTLKRWDYRAIGIFKEKREEIKEKSTEMKEESTATAQPLGFILRSNGPFACGGLAGVASPECNIAVGERFLEGVVRNSAPCLSKLLKRMEKVIKRGGEAKLRIEGSET